MSARLSTGLPPVCSHRVRCAAVLLALGLVPAAARAQDRDRETFDLAVGLLRRELHEDAAKQFERFLRRHPRHDLAPEASYRLGTCYQTLEHDKKAIAAYRRTLEAGSEFRLYPECLYRLGKTLQRSGDKDGAQRVLRRLIESQKRDHYLRVPALYAEGECLRDLAKKTEAIAAFNEAAELETGEKGTFGMPALYHAGFLQMDLGRFADAAKTFRAAAKRWPLHEAQAECLYLEGEAAYRGKDWATADAAYARAVRAGGKFVPAARLGLAWCKLKAGKPRAAVTGFRDVIARHPDSAQAIEARLEAGRTLYGLHDYEAAREILDDLLTRRLPAVTHIAGLELRGLSRLDAGHAKDAVADLTAALEADPDTSTKSRLRYELGEAWSDLREWKRARAAYEAAIPDAGDDDLRGDALYGACLAQNRLGDYETSIRFATELADKLPRHRLVVEARYAIGENLFALGKYPAADASYEQVPAKHGLARRAQSKRAWCAYLANNAKLGAERFSALAGGKDALAEEALSMAALCWLQAGVQDAALETADRYLARFPKGQYLARTERVAGQVYRMRDDFKAAAARIARAVAAETSKERASEDRLQLGELLFRQGDFEAARKVYAELETDTGKTGARALQGLAWCAFEIADDTACLDYVARAMKHPAGRAARPAMLELASSVYHRTRDWAAARRVAEQFMREFPKHARVNEMRYAKGVAEARAGDFGAARKTLEAATKGKLERPDRAYYELGWACVRLKDEEAALRAFAIVARTTEDTDLAGESLLHLAKAEIAAKHGQRARAMLVRVKGKYEPQALYRAGFSLLDEKRPAEALPYFEQIVRLGPERTSLFGEALFLAGESLYRSGKHAEAAQRYRALIARKPDHSRSQVARLHLGECDVLLKDYAGAVSVLEDYVARSAQDKSELGRAERARAWCWLGKAGFGRKEYDRAEAAFSNVTSLASGELAAEAQFWIGTVRQARGQLDRAVEAYLKLSILYEDEAWVPRSLLAAADCYKKLKQSAKAKKFLNELVRRFPKTKASQEARARLDAMKKD